MLGDVLSRRSRMCVLLGAIVGGCLFASVVGVARGVVVLGAGMKNASTQARYTNVVASAVGGLQDLVPTAGDVVRSRQNARRSCTLLLQVPHHYNPNPASHSY